MEGGIERKSVCERDRESDTERETRRKERESEGERGRELHVGAAIEDCRPAGISLSLACTIQISRCLPQPLIWGCANVDSRHGHAVQVGTVTPAPS